MTHELAIAAIDKQLQDFTNSANVMLARIEKAEVELAGLRQSLEFYNSQRDELRASLTLLQEEGDDFVTRGEACDWGRG